jgi:AIPR protein
MSILHVNQIAGALRRMFDNLIDLSDAPVSGPDHDKCFLTRSLAAFAIAQLAGIVPADAAKTVTDGTNDNGIDALHYDLATKTMYVVQAKWHSDGNGSLDRADVLKFTKGFGDLANLSLDRFNERVRSKELMINAAFADDQATYVLVPIHTGAQDFGVEPKQDLEDCLNQYNDTSNPDATELLTARILKQSDVHALVARGVQGTPIDIEIVLYEWGEAKDPFSVYGQIAASDIAGWWKNYYPQIVSQNIRMFLGTDTEVNAGLQTTLVSDPEHFWHFNNGITVVCREIKPKMMGGRSKDSGYFTCYDVRIVNGAQTAGSIAAVAGKKPNAVEKARVHVRFIAVGSEEFDTLGNAITKATNTQNRINRQDFVSLDPEQQRLRTELSIEGIVYNYKSGEGTIRDPKTSDIDEATVALACASPDLGLSTQAKREIGKLWEDTSKTPYKALFNPSVSGLKMWHCIQIMRHIDRALQDKLKVVTGRDSGFLIHGNRCMAHMTFQKLPAAVVNGSGSLPADIDVSVRKLVDEVYAELTVEANALYPQAYLAQLFKNQKKLAEITEKIANKIPALTA